ncbi:16S rRNA (cytosine(967)-C(5))-methyltransferase RsmB [Aquabacterium sp.]|uniref:16S rRNA (cytosine(967)-C(5))-methyltransferase RsmB n=1 Tax=Aquabacterium sp. TaxID=1872578 RepID=UPI003D6CF8B0
MTLPSPSPSPLSLPLWQLLAGCADAITAVSNGQSLTEALTACRPAERPGVQALSFTVLRRIGRAQALRQALVSKKPAPWVDSLLISALALACGTEYDEHTLVDQAVTAAKRKAERASGLVNAVLRRFLRERDALMAATDRDVMARYNHPEWWIARLQQDWPEHWETLLAANQVQPPMTLRVNARQSTASAYLQSLQDAGIPGQLLPEAAHVPHAIVLDAAVPVNRLPGFDQGAVSVQDASAQRAAHLLLAPIDGQTLPPGAHVLDACAAPGGKTAHLLELADLTVTAIDADPERLKRIDDTLARLHLSAKTVAADASQPDTWWDGEFFDAILLDAPCSASGIVRRHPDVRWLRRDSDIAQLARTQDAMLTALWPKLKPGGRLLYCTCSVFKQEGQARIDAFLQRTPSARALPAPGHLLPVVEYPDAPAMGDGFFYALLLKTP